jgi:hypothetical protein
LQVEGPMCINFICVFSFLIALILAEPASCENIVERNPSGQEICSFVRTAAAQTQLEAEAKARLREAEIFTATELEFQSVSSRENLVPTDGANFHADRRLFESLLINWQFFEDLSEGQRAIIRSFLSRCDVDAGRPPLAASVFGQLSTSQRATFVGVTHALLNTSLTDRTTEEPLGDALELIEELIDIQGENDALPSDQQFQLIVRLTPDALEKLERSSHFEKGENHVFHKEFPISFRQFRKIGTRGQEAGLHFCLTRDGKLAQIHIDYRFGLLHLEPANSDVRADGNHQRHADRWPKFSLAVRPARIRRVVL